MEMIIPSQIRSDDAYFEWLYQRHAIGARVRSGACLVMWASAFFAFFLDILKVDHIIGISAANVFLILYNLPALWILKRITDRRLGEYFSLLINTCEIVGYTSVIYFLGGLQATYLTPIYATIIAYVGIFGQTKLPFQIANICSLAFGVMVALEYVGIIPHHNTNPYYPPPWLHQLAAVFVVAILLNVVAAISAYAGHLLKKNREQLNIAHLELEKRVEERTAQLEKSNEQLKREIVQRTRMENSLRKSEEQFRFLTENMIDIVWILDRDFRTTYVSPSIETVIGFTPEERKRQTLEEMVTTESFQRVQEKFLEELRHDEEGTFDPDRAIVIDVEFRHKNGSTVWMENSVKAIRNSEGFIVGMHGVSRNITERKRMEKNLRDSEEKFRSVVERANDGITIIQDDRFVYTNPMLSEIMGYRAEEILRTPFHKIIVSDELPKLMNRYNRRLLGENLPSVYETMLTRKDGKKVCVELNAGIIQYQGRPADLVLIRDITERKHAEEEKKKLEAQIQQAQRIEALGTLAGGIAHDFNNLLMGIQGRASLMLMDSDTASSHFEHLKGIEDYVKNAADLTKQLLGFARGGKYEIKPTDLNELIIKQNQLFGRTRKEINIEEKFEPNLWTVEVDRGQIELVLMNIYVNAWQAMPGGGSLYVRTEMVIIPEEDGTPHQVKPGDYVKISITDTGVGMDEATRQRIFDPFFTTKEMGRGTGLGLASAYGIIRNHGGFITVFSKKGQGATFNLCLPASEKKAIQENGSAQVIVKGSGTVLLVDDEDVVIDVGKPMLEKMGYTVLSATGGRDAVDCYKHNRDSIDLVVLDMIMPDISGRETYDKLKEIDPEIKVLLSSGYSISGQATEILERGCNGFIQKPFNMADLSKKLREILGND